jgi:hypothetical protein
MLCRAFQDSDGPFPIRIRFSEKMEHAFLTIDEIGNISEWEETAYIELVKLQKDRRWRERSSSLRWFDSNLDMVCRRSNRLNIQTDFGSFT